MKMIPGSGSISNYGSYISNCQRNQMPYKIPVNSLADVQLYISMGATQPDIVEYQMIKTCGGSAITTLGTPDYVVGQDTNGNWYGVFRNFPGPTPSCFVIAITLSFGGTEQIYFSEEYCHETNCGNGGLELIKGCYGHPDNVIAYDCQGVYYGSPQGSAVGDETITYRHQLLLRDVEVSLFAIKNSFKQGRTRNFRTEKERVYQFLAEFVPEWYLSEVDAVFNRGEVYVGSTKYLLNETQFEKIEDCKRMWRPAASFKESCFQSFTCEADPCAVPPEECCDPEFISVTSEEAPFESGFPPESGDSGIESGVTSTGEIVVIQAVVDGIAEVTGTVEPITGITDGSMVINCAAFAGVRVIVQRGNIQIPGINPGDGSNFYTKPLGSTGIAFSTPLVAGEFIYIETIP